MDAIIGAGITGLSYAMFAGNRDYCIRVFHKPNGGVSSARNLGLDNARSEWIAFLDSDDRRRLNRQVRN